MRAAKFPLLSLKVRPRVLGELPLLQGMQPVASPAGERLFFGMGALLRLFSF